MATEKVSLTLDRDVVAEARALAGPSGLSSFVNEALIWRLQRARVGRLLSELESEHGPVDQRLLMEALAERAALPSRSDEPSGRKGGRRAG